METIWSEISSNRIMAPKWGRFIIISLLAHLAAFSTIFIVPESIPTRRIKGIIYEVNLVELPAREQAKGKQSINTKGVTKRPGTTKKATSAKRISSTRKKKDAVVIAKRTLSKKKQATQKPKVTTSKLIDQAVSKIKSKIKAEKKDHLKQALAKLETKFPEGTGKERPGSQAQDGITIQIYKMEVENQVKSNWSFPVADLSPHNQKDLEAIVRIKVKKNGTILKFWFKKESSNTMFDQSVLKAVDRSDPLPPFPEGYRKTYDELEITFNLRDLEIH